MQKGHRVQKSQRSMRVRVIQPDDPACGLCGHKAKPRARTACCGNWVCDNENEYVMFSYGTNSCIRNHRRYTLCAAHHTEGHKGDWKTCKKCLQGYEPEMAHWYGTNEFNFEKHPNPPSFEPTLCVNCRQRIDLGNDGYSMFGREHACERCMARGYEFK